MAVTAVLLRRIREALPPATVVCCVGAVGAWMRGAAASRSVATATPASGATTAGCASLSPLYNEDLLRRKRRTKNARKHSAGRQKRGESLKPRPDKEAGRRQKYQENKIAMPPCPGGIFCRGVGGPQTLRMALRPKAGEMPVGQRGMKKSFAEVSFPVCSYPSPVPGAPLP